MSIINVYRVIYKVAKILHGKTIFDMVLIGGAGGGERRSNSTTIKKRSLKRKNSG